MDQDIIDWVIPEEYTVTKAYDVVSDAKCLRSTSSQTDIPYRTNKRKRKSAQKIFVDRVFEILESNPAGITINKMAEMLKVRKRRIYDVTVILEAIGRVTSHKKLYYLI